MSTLAMNQLVCRTSGRDAVEEPKVDEIEHGADEPKRDEDDVEGARKS